MFDRDSGVDASTWLMDVTSPAPVQIETSDIEGCGGSVVWDAAFGADSGGNLDVDPQFVAASGPDTAPSATGDYRLLRGSPLIDLGRRIHPESVDAGGGPRLLGEATDLGGHEGGTEFPLFADGFESGDTEAWQ